MLAHGLMSQDEFQYQSMGPSSFDQDTGLLLVSSGGLGLHWGGTGCVEELSGTWLIKKEEDSRVLGACTAKSSWQYLCHSLNCELT